MMVYTTKKLFIKKNVFIHPKITGYSNFSNMFCVFPP